MKSGVRPALPLRLAAAATTAVLGLGLVLSGTPHMARADELDDEKRKLQNKAHHLKSNLEGLDANIAAKIKKLETLQGKLPGAQQQLADAEQRVRAATDEVNSLNERLAVAEQQKADLTAEIQGNQKTIDRSHKLMGQMASEAYKRGGISEDLSFLLGVRDSSLPATFGLTNQAMRFQDQRVSSSSQRNAADKNAEARMKAVQERINDLRGKAEQALQREESAKEQAANYKAEVEGLIEQTESLTADLKAQRPAIQRQLKENLQAQTVVNQKIAERQERLRRQAEAARKRAEALARKRWLAEQRRRAAEARRQNRPVPKPQPFVPPAPPSSGGSGLSWPINGPITSGFGWRPTPSGTYDYGGMGGYVHTGIDFGAPCGAPIRAAGSGEVWYADWAVWTSGNRVVISHGIVNGRPLATKYHHMTRYVVRPGQKVSKGQIIGYVGTTGNSTGCHLHFETIVNGQAVNPRSIL